MFKDVNVIFTYGLLSVLYKNHVISSLPIVEIMKKGDCGDFRFPHYPLFPYFPGGGYLKN